VKGKSGDVAVAMPKFGSEPEPAEPDRGSVQVQVQSRHSHARFGSGFSLLTILETRTEPHLLLY
jgi:hypothetical protein